MAAARAKADRQLMGATDSTSDVIKHYIMYIKYMMCIS